MAQQYLGVVARAASSFVEGDNRSKGRKDNDLVTRMEGEAVRTIGAKLRSGDTMSSTTSSHPKRVGQLFNSVSSWHQDNYGSSGNGYGNRGMPNDAYDNQRGGYGGYTDTRAGGYGGGSGYGYESRGYGGDAGWNPSGGMNASGAGGLGRQGYYDSSNNYDGYGNRGRMDDGYSRGGMGRMNDGYY